MAYFLIYRSRYYGPRTGECELIIDDGEPLSYDSRDAALEEIGCHSLSNSEYARDYKLLEGTIESEQIQLARKLPSYSTSIAQPVRRSPEQ